MGVMVEPHTVMFQVGDVAWESAHLPCVRREPEQDTLREQLLRIGDQLETV